MTSLEKKLLILSATIVYAIAVDLIGLNLIAYSPILKENLEELAEALKEVFA